MGKVSSDGCVSQGTDLAADSWGVKTTCGLIVAANGELAKCAEDQEGVLGQHDGHLPILHLITYSSDKEVLPELCPLIYPVQTTC